MVTNWNEAVKNLRSRYIPVGKLELYDDRLNFWDKDKGVFWYPYFLMNLETLNAPRKELNIPDDVFMLNDSGGFQVITGKYHGNWEDSLKKQIYLGANKLFAFDRPPLKPKIEGSRSDFVTMDLDTTKKLIIDNIEVALKQSAWLKENHPDRIKDFYYIMHGSSKALLDFNLEELEKRIGNLDENYKKYFGGVCYSVKIGNEFIKLTTFCLHAKHYFEDKGVPVHILGFGSSNRMIIMVRCKISTFDSATALEGIVRWSYFNNINLTKGSSFITEYNKGRWPHEKMFCDCPACQIADWPKFLKEKPEKMGNYIFVHNVYQMIKLNIFLDSIKKDEYTRVVKDWLTVPDRVILGLEYCDYADKHGFHQAYEKYKHFEEKDTTVQRGLF